MATFPRGHWTAKAAAHNNAVRRTLDRQSHTIAGKITWIVTAGDELTLRGIPAIGRGVAGAIHGTNPATLRDL